MNNSQTQKRFKSKSQNVFTETINKIDFSLNEEKRIQLLDLIKTYLYGTSKDLGSEKEKIKCNDKIRQCKK